MGSIDAKVDGHLQKGLCGDVSITVNSLNAEIDGQKIEATGISTGMITADATKDGTNVGLERLSIDHAKWTAPVKTPTPAANNTPAKN